ncbi:hypothetical protein ACTA71_005965 [Dictyostelium dimigraforme]
MAKVEHCKVPKGKNGDSVKVLGDDYLILNLKTVGELRDYILSKNKKTNNKFDGWIENYDIEYNYSKMFGIYYLSGRIAPPRSLAKDPSRLLTSKDDFLVVVRHIISNCEVPAVHGKIKKEFTKSAWGWFNCKKDLAEFFSGKKKPKKPTTYDSGEEEEEREEIKEDDSDDSIDSDDSEDDFDDSDDEKVPRDPKHDSDSKAMDGLSFRGNQKDTPKKVAAPIPSPPTPTPPIIKTSPTTSIPFKDRSTPKGKETPIKTPNPPKKRKWDDSDSDYEPETFSNNSAPTVKIITRRNNNDEKESIPTTPKIAKTTTTTTTTSSSSSTTPTITPIECIIDSSLDKRLIVDNLDLIDRIFKRLDEIDDRDRERERERKRRQCHRKNQNKKTSRSGDEDDQFDDNIENSQQQQQQQQQLKIDKRSSFINVELSSKNVSVCAHSDDHHLSLDQLEKITLLPLKSVSFNSGRTLTEALVYCENPLGSFIPISRKDDNGYVFVIASVNQNNNYYIGVVNLNNPSLSDEIIEELKEHQLAFDYQPSFDIEKIKTIEGKPIKELQFFEYHH